jgi:hypothetical protein
MTRVTRPLSTEAPQYRPETDDSATDGLSLGFLRVVATIGDDVCRRCLHVPDAEGCLKSLQPTLPDSCVPLRPTPFCTNHKPRVHNCGAVPL